MMQKWSIPRDEAITIRFLLFDRFSNLCLANCLEPMRAANDFAKSALFQWRFLTPSGQPVSSSSDLPVLPEAAAERCDPCDYLFILASYDHLIHDTPATRSLLRQITAKAKTVIGFDTSPWLMASAGLLDGRKATVHWDVLDAFSERFLQVETERRRIVEDGHILTCAGAHSAYDLTRKVIASELGQAAVVDIDNLFVRTENGTSLGARSHGLATSIVQRALAVMQDNLEQPLRLSELSSAIACPPKTLSRRFRQELGTSPGLAYRHLRLTHARQLLENTRLSVSEVALRTGYESPAALTRAFKNRFGLLPRQIKT
ncbi:MAG: GlxA family transcriptional regulator [Candidatus Puniceispirillaceae bacterium]